MSRSDNKDWLRSVGSWKSTHVNPNMVQLKDGQLLCTSFIIYHLAFSVESVARYYNGEILSGVPGTSRRPPQGIAWPVSEVPITFLPVGGQEIAEGAMCRHVGHKT